MIKVAIVDDHRVIVDGLEYILNATSGIEVVGKAYSIAECRLMLEHCSPNVLMLDLSLEDGNSLYFCPEIIKLYPDVNILILTSFDQPSILKRALEAGVKGYIMKNSHPQEIIKGVLEVGSGHTFLCKSAENIIRESNEPSASLTLREQEILQLIVDGYTMKEIADKLCLGFETIRSYSKYIRIKLGANNTASTVRIALEQGLVQKTK